MRAMSSPSKLREMRMAMLRLRKRWAQVGGEIAEMVVGEGAGGAVDAEHAAGAADLGRVLRDEVFGEVEIEVGDEHKAVFSSQCSVLSFQWRGPRPGPGWTGAWGGLGRLLGRAGARLGGRGRMAWG